MAPKKPTTTTKATSTTRSSGQLHGESADGQSSGPSANTRLQGNSKSASGSRSRSGSNGRIEKPTQDSISKVSSRPRRTTTARAARRPTPPNEEQSDGDNADVARRSERPGENADSRARKPFTCPECERAPRMRRNGSYMARVAFCTDCKDGYHLNCLPAQTDPDKFSCPGCVSRNRALSNGPDNLASFVESQNQELTRNGRGQESLPSEARNSTAGSQGEEELPVANEPRTKGKGKGKEPLHQQTQTARNTDPNVSNRTIINTSPGPAPHGYGHITAQPTAGLSQPTASSSRPIAGSSQPTAGSSQPAASSSQPIAGSSQIPANTTVNRQHPLPQDTANPSTTQPPRSTSSLPNRPPPFPTFDFLIGIGDTFLQGINAMREQLTTHDANVGTVQRRLTHIQTLRANAPPGTEIAVDQQEGERLIVEILNLGNEERRLKQELIRERAVQAERLDVLNRVRRRYGWLPVDIRQ